MQKQVSLSTVALLSLLWDKEGKDYLDVIAQFVLRSLPAKVNERIDVDDITKCLRTEYGFDDIPRHVVEKALIRLCKKPVKKERYVHRYNHEYYTSAIFNPATFDHNRSETQDQISSVLQDLSLFLEQHYLRKRIDDNTAAEYLFRFFETYSLTMLHDSTKLKSVTEASGTSNFHVARFILNSIETRKDIEKRLVQITKGFLIYKAVYFFTSEIKVSVESKLQNVKFYLDCSLVIDALGYDSISEEKAFDEMNQLVRSNGGQVCVFEHTIEEASNLLEAYAHNPQNHNSFSFPELEKKNYPSDALFAIAQPQAIEEKLKKKQITICKLPSFTPKSNRGKRLYIGFQDEDAIESQLKKYQEPAQRKTSVKSGKRIPRHSSSRMEYDVKSLSAIGRLREGKQPSNIEKCEAIIITQDWTLCNCMHDLYPKLFPPEISFAIKDIDIVSLLWLGQYNKESQLPKNILIANAVAACEVSQDVMDQAIELATRMEKDGILQPEAALIMRSTHAIRSFVLEKTQNNPNKLTEDSIKAIIASFVESESSSEKMKAIQDAVDQKTDQLATIHAKEIEEKNHQIEKMISEQRDNAIKMRDDAEQSAKKKAKHAASIIKIALGLLWLLITGASVYCWLNVGIGTGIAAVVLSVLSLLQIADYLLKFVNVPQRISKHVEDWVFTKAYDQELVKREKISHISLRI